MDVPLYSNSDKMNKKTLTSFLITLSIVLAFFIGFFSSESSRTIETRFLDREKSVYISESRDISVRSLSIPAVSENEKGIFGEITVIVKNGTGMINIDVSNLLIDDDTEASLRKAAHYAFDYTEKDIENHDISYHLETNSPAIKGSSAGASAAVLTIAALKNRTIRDDVMITGTIHHDGEIGPADKIIPKAEAARKANSSIFLVPRTQSKKRNMTRSEYCAEYGGTEFCSNEYTPEVLDVEEESDITVREVRNVTEALEHFF